MENTFENKIAILAEIWETKRDEPLFAELLEWHDFTFPTAWAIKHGLAIPTEPSLVYFGGAYSELLKLLEVDDNLYSDYDELTGTEE